MKRVGSFNLTEEGYQALATIQRKTGKSKKEIVSSALEAALTPVLDKKVVEFKLPDPKEVMLFRTDIAVLEASAKELVQALFGLRPRDKDYAKKIAEVIGQIQNHLLGLQAIDSAFREKIHLLKGLSPEDYQRLPKVVKWAVDYRSMLKGEDVRNRTILLDIIERLARLAAPAAFPSK